MARMERESMGELRYSAIGLSGCCKREECIEEMEAIDSKRELKLNNVSTFLKSFLIYIKGALNERGDEEKD